MSGVFGETREVSSVLISDFDCAAQYGAVRGLFHLYSVIAPYCIDTAGNTELPAGKAGQNEPT